METKKNSELFTSFFIGKVKIPNKMILAPMAGFSDIGFRRVCKFCGAGLTCTEMVSAKALVSGSAKTEELLRTFKSESPKAVQIFGHDPEVMAAAVKHPAIQKFDIIDINMGCPMPKIVKNGDGSALMEDLKKSSKIISACANATSKPITVKFRKGIDDSKIIAVEFAKMCEKSGAAAITIHGRTRAQMYAGKSDEEVIKSVVKAVKIPVIANGDVTSPTKASELLKKTGAEAVMIGRGSIGNPSIFGKKIKSSTAIKMQINEMLKYFEDKYVTDNMKKHLVHYFHGEKNAAKIRKQFLNAKTTKEIFDVLEKIK